VSSGFVRDITERKELDALRDDMTAMISITTCVLRLGTSFQAWICMNHIPS